MPIDINDAMTRLRESRKPMEARTGIDFNVVACG
jgi:hypothetical protein